MAKEKVLLFVLLFFIQGTLIAQVKVSNLDFNYWYNETPGVKGEILAAREDSSALLLVRIDASLDSLRKYELTYSLVNSLDDNISSRYQLAPISTYFQYEDNQSSYYGIKVILKDAKFFVLWFSDLQRHISYPIVKKLPEPKSPAELVMYRKYFNAPIVSNYITQGTEVRVRPLDGIPTNLNVNYYDYHFQPAMPPMSQVPGSDSTNFTADLSYRIVTDDTLVFQNNGLYYLAIQGAKIGRSVIVTNDFRGRIVLSSL